MINLIMEKSKGRLITVVMLGLVVIGFPLVSLLVNLKGAETGKAFYSTLKKKYGKVPTINALTWQNDSLKNEKIKGKVMVVSFISPQNRDTIMNVLRPVIKTEQFRYNVDNLTFLTFDLTEDSIYATNYLKNMNQWDHNTWKILRGGNDIMPAFHLPTEFSVALVDTAGDIRCYYDTRKPEDKKMLVEHISVMPIKRDKNPEKRDQKQL
jgi:hypothetical protein